MRIQTGVEEEDSEIQLAPMIDVIFQLIIFFLCASTFNPPETELSVNLPAVPTEQTQKVDIPDEVEITILADGGVVVMSTEYDTPGSHQLPQLRSMLVQLAAISEKQPVIIAPHPEAYHGRVVEVLNACAAAGITSISFYATL